MRRSFIPPLVSGLCLLAAPSALALIDFNANEVSDLWEKLHNEGALFDPQNPDHLPTADPDGDGWKNIQEALAGPRTGRPVERRACSVSVFAHDCATADAWATALFILGPEYETLPPGVEVRWHGTPALGKGRSLATKDY